MLLCDLRGAGYRGTIVYLQNPAFNTFRFQRSVRESVRLPVLSERSRALLIHSVFFQLCLLHAEQQTAMKTPKNDPRELPGITLLICYHLFVRRDSAAGQPAAAWCGNPGSTRDGVHNGQC